MNEEFLNQYENVYVPAVSDEGALGVYQHADCTINNNIHKSNTFKRKEYEFSMKFIYR